MNNAQAYNIKAVNMSLGVPGVKYTSECSNSSYKTAFANVVPQALFQLLLLVMMPFLMVSHPMHVLLVL